MQIKIKIEGKGVCIFLTAEILNKRMENFKLRFKRIIFKKKIKEG